MGETSAGTAPVVGGGMDGLRLRSRSRLRLRSWLWLWLRKEG